MKFLLLKKLNFLQLAASIALLVIASSVAYYLVVFLPSKERIKLELQKTEREVKDSELKIYEDCDVEAKDDAKELLKSKIEVAQKAGQAIPSTWKEASEKGLMLKDDYNAQYESCIRRHGLKY